MGEAEQPPNHAGDFQLGLLARAKLVDPAEDQRVQTRWQVELFNCCGILRVDAAVAQVVEQLLDVERVTLRFLRNACNQRGRGNTFAFGQQLRQLGRGSPAWLRHRSAVPVRRA
jgi:hypothetical protein